MQKRYKCTIFPLRILLLPGHKERKKKHLIFKEQMERFAQFSLKRNSLEEMTFQIERNGWKTKVSSSVSPVYLLGSRVVPSFSFIFLCLSIYILFYTWHLQSFYCPLKYFNLISSNFTFQFTTHKFTLCPSYCTVQWYSPYLNTSILQFFISMETIKVCLYGSTLMCVLCVWFW